MTYNEDRSKSVKQISACNHLIGLLQTKAKLPDTQGREVAVMERWRWKVNRCTIRMMFLSSAFHPGAERL